MLQKKCFLFIVMVGLIVSGCTSSEDVRQEVVLPSGETIERVRISPEAEEVRRVMIPIVRGRVKLIPAPGSESMPEEYRTTLVAIEREDKKMMIATGELVNRLRNEAVDRDVVIRGSLQSRHVAYGTERYPAIVVTEIINIDTN